MGVYIMKLWFEYIRLWHLLGRNLKQKKIPGNLVDIYAHKIIVEKNVNYFYSYIFR